MFNLKKILGLNNKNNKSLSDSEVSQGPEQQPNKEAYDKLNEEVSRQRSKAREARRQRELARNQRDTAREERELARNQRKELSKQLKYLEKRAQQGRGKKQTTFLKELNTTNEEYLKTKSENPTLENVSLSMTEIDGGIVSPEFLQVFPKKFTPPRTVAFVTVANYLFVPGLELLISSLLDVYPDIDSDIIIYHDGTITNFSQENLKSMYHRVKFIEPDMSWIESIPQDSGNRKRIGILGYMSVMALGLTEYERVIIIDSDTAVIDDVSAFWFGEDTPLGSNKNPNILDSENIIACHDHGIRPWAAISALGHPIINSGILSIPKKYMTQLHLEEIKAFVCDNHSTLCKLLDRFADQKAWNRFIYKYVEDTIILPVNFNCNIKFLDNSRNGDMSFVRMIHFAGHKPWFDKNYLSGDLIPESDATAIRSDIWRDLYKQLVSKSRQIQFQKEINSDGYFQPPSKPFIFEEKPTCLMIGNGPSLKKTDLKKIVNIETFVYNWFVHHPDFDSLKPTNLVLGSHMFFGGWSTQKPEMPKEYVEALLAKKWRPQIWTSFYFREFFNSWQYKDEFDIKYALFEKPHKNFVDACGYVNLDANGFSNDSRTGVLSVGLPIALQKGYKHIALIGCDSNYNQSSNTDSNYFYDQSLHASKETRQESLTQTWDDGGQGIYTYTRVQEALEKRCSSLLDFTIEGRLPLPKRNIDQLYTTY